MSRKVIVVGAGIAGLAIAGGLAQRGFAVEVLERAAEAREFGAGLMLKHNSLTALRNLGVQERLEADGVRLQSAHIVDDFGGRILTRDLDNEWTVMVRRQHLHTVLLEAAVQAGARLRLSSEVLSADPEGSVLLADGTRLSADLVIAADGRRSAIRESLGMGAVTTDLPVGATRTIFRREEAEPRAMEYWSGPRRVGFAPASRDETYAFLMHPESDQSAGQVPLDVKYWTEAFPALASVFERIGESENVFHHFISVVFCKRWISGNVALVGDAAHSMTPDLGQGANLAIDIGADLIDFIDGAADLHAALSRWERMTRPRADAVQMISLAYDFVGYQLPPSLVALRSTAVQWFAANPGGEALWDFYWRGGLPKPSLEDWAGTAARDVAQSA